MKKWIPIKKKMPSFEDGQIIVSNFIEDGTPQQIVICAVCWDGKFYLLEWWGANERKKIKGVTHWMPLPSPPAE